MRHRIGLKLWSTNFNYIQEALRLYRQDAFDYLELFVVPESFIGYSDYWVHLEIPYIIHAPHYEKGVDLSLRAAQENNLHRAAETLAFADKLSADTVIFHPGVAGELTETARQLRLINDRRIVVENKPYFGHNNVFCKGTSPEDITYIMDNANVGFCLDVSHAICAANAVRVDPLYYLRRFIELCPKMYHLSDGDYDGVYDCHNHLGTGNYRLGEIISLIPVDSRITVETDKNFTDRLHDFEQDVLVLNSLLCI